MLSYEGLLPNAFFECDLKLYINLLLNSMFSILPLPSAIG